jgi:hypothetical protein
MGGLTNASGQGLWNGTPGLSGSGILGLFNILLEPSTSNFLMLEDGTTFIELQAGP